MYLLYVLPVFLSYFAFCFVAAVVVVVVASLLFLVSFIFPDAVHYLLLTCIVCVVCLNMNMHCRYADIRCTKNTFMLVYYYRNSNITYILCVFFSLLSDARRVTANANGSIARICMFTVRLTRKLPVFFSCAPKMMCTHFCVYSHNLRPIHSRISDDVCWPFNSLSCWN